MTEPLRNIVIVGGGAACWLAAAALVRVAQAQGGKVEVIDTGPDSSERDAEGSMPALRALHRILSVEERDLMGQVQATFRLGTEFRDWSGEQRAWFHPYGELGANLESIGFHHHWLRLHEGEAQRDAEPLTDFSLSAVAAQLGRFAHPAADTHSPLAMLDYGMHVDMPAYARYLRGYAERAGVARRAGRVANVELRSTDGFIAALGLDGGERVEADLFIDCTGTEARLIGAALGTAFEDWSHWLPCDRIVTAASAGSEHPRPYESATAHSAGWRWRMPLRHRTDNGSVFSSRFMSDDEARALLTRSLEGRVLNEPRLWRVRAGRRVQPWHRNCIALGNAAGFFEPLESTYLHRVHSAISKLIGLFPHRRSTTRESDEFNRLLAGEQERIRDWLILLYKGAGRSDSPFWQACRALSVPETLARKIELFTSRGRVVLYDEEPFPESSWVSVFAGQRQWPRRIDPRAEGVDPRRMHEQLRRMKAVIRRTAESLPTHGEFLERHG